MKSLSALTKPVITGLIAICMLHVPVFSQSPVAISGFNHDVVADAGNSSLATTTIPLDGVTVSNKVMYNVTFRNLNGFGGGALPDDGFILNASGTYQLSPYTANNALLLQRGQNGDLTINTPASFTRLRIAALSTEGPSLLNITLFFTDGSSTTALTNYTLSDWFNGTTNLIETGFGRCNRVAAVVPSDADAYPNNPRLYYIEVILACADRAKLLQKINFANVTTAGSNAPYPNAVFFAVSGNAAVTVSHTQTSANCTTNGTATLTVNGSTGPYNATWNTTPVQSGLTATNLAPGTYTATITDAQGCSIPHNVTIPLVNNMTMGAEANTSICSGASFTSSIVSNAQNFSWSPTTGVSNPGILNPVFSPTTTTTYTLTGTTGPCTRTTSFIITVNDVSLNVHADTTICPGASFNANSTGSGTTYSWSPTTGVSDPAIANPVLSPANTTTYTVTATAGSCTTTKTFTVTVLPVITAAAGSDVTITQGESTQLQGSGSDGTILWTPATGLSAVNILNPIANPVVTTTYVLTITSPQGCTVSDNVDVTVLPYCIKAMNAITPNGDGINDQWLVYNASCVANASVHVYNRYGSPVYENKDYKNDWNGTYKGKAVPDATYYFVIEYKLLDGREVIVKGNLTILR